MNLKPEQAVAVLDTSLRAALYHIRNGNAEIAESFIRDAIVIRLEADHDTLFSHIQRQP